MSGYIGSLPTPVATQSRDDFTATSGQTTFVSSGYTAGYIDIYLNGVHLKDGTDYTATNGTDVVLTVAAVLNDIIELVAFDTFDVIANTVTGNLAVSGTVDGRDVAADGSTLDSAVDAIALNTAKTGITSGQASAITANTAKVTNVAHPLVEKAVPSNAVFTDTNTTYSVGDGGLTQNNFTDADHTKLNAIESSATADQTKSDIEGLGIDVPATNLTGTIAAARLSTATTQAESDDSTKIATTAYVVDKITTLIGGAPSTLNDLNELAAAINDDASYNSTLTTALATKLPLSGGTMTGNIAHGGDFTLDVTGNLTLDAGGGDIFLKQNGVHYGSIKRNNGDLQIHSETSDEDILFVGNDGGNAITALTLDMSDAGTALFNNNVGIGITSLSSGYGASHALQIASVSDNNWGGTLVLSSANGTSVLSRLVASTSGFDIINEKNTPTRIFANNTERLRINANARICINGSATTNGHGNFVGEAGAGSKALMFEHTVGGGETGSITTGSSSTAYNTSSDYRLKENVVSLTGASARVNQLNPSRFNFIADDTNTLIDGFLAHEVATVVPEAIHGTHNEVDDENNAVMQGIDQSKLVPLLTAALQEALTEINDLKNRVTTLEAV